MRVNKPGALKEAAQGRLLHSQPEHLSLEQPKATKPVNDKLGHRGRLRDRLLASDANVADYELLEMLLFASNARGDTKPLAKALLKRFGGFAAVLNADADELTQVEGCGPSAVASLKVVLESAKRLVREETLNSPVLGSAEKLIDYCRLHLSHKKIEEFHLLFLDTKNRLIEHEAQQKGTVDQTSVYVREVVKRALALNASGLILVHNHPSGDPKPSRADVSLTRQIIEACEPLSLRIHDHLIIGRSGHISLRTEGLMEEGAEFQF